MRERRKFKRYKAILDTRYTKVEGYVTISSLTATKNICLGGLCTTLSKVVKRGNKLIIELGSPYKKTIAALAEVIWVKKEDNNRRNICGLKFLWLSSKSLLSDWFAFLEGANALLLI